jgi:hypothetical protein
MRIPAAFLAAALAAAVSVAQLAGPAAAEEASGGVKFVPHRIGKFRGEACGVGDFNGDGRPDIVAGEFLYLAPEWKAKKIRTIQGDINEEGKGYNWDFMNAPLDVDGDGRLDVVSCSWHGMQIEWYRNPGDAEGDWPVALVEKNGNFEHGELWDVDGDGKKLEIVPGVTGTWWYEIGTLADGTRGLVKRMVSPKPYNWGVGVGDVNGDGRPDLLRPDAWFEAPADPRAGEWVEHPLAVGSLEAGKADHTPQIVVYDVNADGLNDLITSSAHGYGIFWYEQTKQGGQIAWKQHLIDKSWTQAHSITLADFDHDGDLDFVTGKRFMAHNGNDPDEFAPLGVYWYELRRGPAPEWVKHVISYDEGIGSGMNIPVEDLDGDGDLDIVVTGKWGGPVWFENRR